MTPTLLLVHVYTPGNRETDQEATWEALEALSGFPGLEIVHKPTEGPYGYSEAMAAVWEDDRDIVVCEQDIVPELSHVTELAGCERGHCAFDYALANGVHWTELPQGVGTGLVKWSTSARAGIPEGPKVPHWPYPGFPTVLSNRMGPAHVHRPPVVHNHREP